MATSLMYRWLLSTDARWGAWGVAAVIVLPYQVREGAPFLAGVLGRLQGELAAAQRHLKALSRDPHRRPPSSSSGPSGEDGRRTSRAGAGREGNRVENLMMRRLRQVEDYERNHARGKRISSVMRSLKEFLQSRSPPLRNPVTGLPIEDLEQCSPQSIRLFLCYVDSNGSGRTMVHDVRCPHFGSGARVYGLECDQDRLNCGRRMAAQSLRTGHLTQLVAGFQELGLTGAYDPITGKGNPARSSAVQGYLQFSIREQKVAGISAKQASPLLKGAVDQLLRRMGARFDLGPLRVSVQDRLDLRMCMALFATAFSCGRRGSGLSHIQIPRLMKLADGSGLLAELLLGKTMRQQSQCFGMRRRTDAEGGKAVCPVNLIEEWVRLASSMGFDMTKGWLFFNLSWPSREKRYFDPRAMTRWLRSYLRVLGMRDMEQVTMHSFRVGSCITKLLEGEELWRVMESASWANTATVNAYARLFRVLGPSQAKVGSVSVGQFEEMDTRPAMTLTVADCAKLQMFECDPKASAEACWAPRVDIPPSGSVQATGKGVAKRRGTDRLVVARSTGRLAGAAAQPGDRPKREPVVLSSSESEDDR